MDPRAMIMGVAFALMWSSAFATARVIVADAPPLFALAGRFLISGVIAIALARALGQNWRLSRAQWRATAIFGFCQNGLYLGLNFVAMQWIEASLAAIIASTMPLLVAMLGWAVFGEKVRPLGVAGLVAGVIGVSLIMGARVSGGADLTGILFCGIGSLALAFATLSVRGASSGGNLLMVVGLQMLVGAVLLTLASAILETWGLRWSWGWGAAFAYQILVPGIAATMIWFSLVGRIGAVRASTFHFLNPFFGVVIAALLLGEAIRPLDMLGVAIIMAGILAVQLSKATVR
ncbi:MAG: DMT family transporter [Paracoccaceae bacterium]|nr:DMT family transporter [Paracoccaceae bacterium]